MHRYSAPLLAAMLSLPVAAAVTTTESLELADTHIDTAENAQHPSTRLVDSLLHATGLQQQLPEVRRLFLQARSRHVQRCGLNSTTTLEQGPLTVTTAKPYGTASLQQRLTSRLQMLLQATDVEQMVDWYNTPIGQRVRHSEKMIRSDEAFEQFDATREAPARAAHFATIERHTRANRLGTVVGVETEYGGLIFSGCIVFDQGSRNANSPQTRANQAIARAIRSDLPSYEKIFYADTLSGIAFSLQDLSNSDLSRYADFVKSPAMSQIFASLVSAVEDTLREEADRHRDAASHQTLSSELDAR